MVKLRHLVPLSVARPRLPLLGVSLTKECNYANCPAQSNIGDWPAVVLAMADQDTATFDNINHALWRRAVEAALNEPDGHKLLDRVHAAETAIFNRLQELARDVASQHSSQRAERQAITDALNTLWVLKRDRLGFPEAKMT